MPIYEYQCQSCQKVFEFMQRMSDDPMTECEECKGALERIISQSAFHLKGGGWYKDLYSSTKKDESGKGTSGGSAASTGDASASASSDSSTATSASSDSSSSASSSDSSSSSSESKSSTPSATASKSSASSKD